MTQTDAFPLNQTTWYLSSHIDLYTHVEVCHREVATQHNILIKYADDTNLLVPEYTDCQLDEEFGNIENLAMKIKMIINDAKTKELVYRRPHPTIYDMADPLDGIAQTLLGVFFYW